VANHTGLIAGRLICGSMGREIARIYIIDASLPLCWVRLGGRMAGDLGAGSGRFIENVCICNHAAGEAVLRDAVTVATNQLVVVVLISSLGLRAVVGRVRKWGVVGMILWCRRTGGMTTVGDGIFVGEGGRETTGPGFTRAMAAMQIDAMTSAGGTGGPADLVIIVKMAMFLERLGAWRRPGIRMNRKIRRRTEVAAVAGRGTAAALVVAAMATGAAGRIGTVIVFMHQNPAVRVGGADPGRVRVTARTTVKQSTQE